MDDLRIFRRNDLPERPGNARRGDDLGEPVPHDLAHDIEPRRLRGTGDIRGRQRLSGFLVDLENAQDRGSVSPVLLERQGRLPGIPGIIGTQIDQVVGVIGFALLEEAGAQVTDDLEDLRAVCSGGFQEGPEPFILPPGSRLERVEIVA